MTRVRKTTPVEIFVVVLVLAGFAYLHQKGSGHDNPNKRPTGGRKYSLHLEWRDVRGHTPDHSGTTITYTSASGRPISVPHIGVYTAVEGEWDQDVITTIPPYIVAGPYDEEGIWGSGYRYSCSIWLHDIGGAYLVAGPTSVTTPGLGTRCQASA